SLGRVPVPVWLIILSDQLPIGALVGHYPTNELIGRRPLPGHPRAFFPAEPGPYAVLAPLSGGCPPPRGRFLRVTQPSATAPEGAVRLACFTHPASVCPEPGSNSPSNLPSTRRHSEATGCPRSPSLFAC